MSGLRILYHHRIRADDGQAVHVAELIGALRRLGHDVLECALVPKAPRVETAAVAAGAAAGAAASRPANVATGAGRVWNRLHLPRHAIECLEIGYSRQGARRLCRAAATFRPDFLYERHALHCRAGLLAARRLGLPLLLEVNSPMVDEMERLGLLRFPRLARRTEREVLAGADRVLAVTEVLRERLLQCGAAADRTRVVANGAEPERYGEAARAASRPVRARFPADAFVIGFVGYARPWHRLDLALQAMARPTLRRVHLMVVGEGPALPEIQAAAAETGLADRVHMVGVVPPAELPAHICAFDLALIPSINEYASPLKMFDSLAAGVITLAPDQPNLRERIEDGVNGLLFRPGDVESLVEKLASVVSDPARARSIGATGLQRLRECDWTWQGNARRVVGIFQELGR